MIKDTYIKGIASGGGGGGIDLSSLTTGATVSYRTGDDFNVPFGREANFLTLSANSPAGNTFRFTDTLLGQTFASGVAIDWAYRDNVNELVVGWQIGDNGSNIDWDDAIDYCVALTLDTYTDWYLPNFNLLHTLFNTQTTRALNYIPILDASNNKFWSGTSLTGVLPTYAGILVNQWYGATSAVLKTTTNPMRAKAYRVYTYAELGL
jgi:hypothetical protein